MRDKCTCLKKKKNLTQLPHLLCLFSVSLFSINVEALFG